MTITDFSVTPYSGNTPQPPAISPPTRLTLPQAYFAGSYFLVQEQSEVLLALAYQHRMQLVRSTPATAVALVSAMTALTAGCPLGATVVDFLGYGSTANCSETGPIAVSGTNSNARSVIRTVSCTDTNNNSADFSNPTTAPLARNTATATASCP